MGYVMVGIVLTFCGFCLYIEMTPEQQAMRAKWHEESCRPTKISEVDGVKLWHIDAGCGSSYEINFSTSGTSYRVQQGKGTIQMGVTNGR